MKKYTKPEISIVKIQNDDCLMLSSVGIAKLSDMDKVKFSDIK